MRITKYDTELQDDKLNNPEMISHMMCEIFRADRKADIPQDKLYWKNINYIEGNKMRGNPFGCSYFYTIKEVSM